MPSSLIVVGLVVAWLVVLVPMVVRRRQEIARTADSALAARVVRSGCSSDIDRELDQDPDLESEFEADFEPDDVEEREGFVMREADDELIDDGDLDEPARRYRPGRGGYDPDAAARAARAKYGFRQRVVLAILVLAVLTVVAAIVVSPMMWWAHGAADLALVGYLGYLRRQVRIEGEIRQRRLARMSAVRRSHARPPESYEEYSYDERPGRREPVAAGPTTLQHRGVHPSAEVLEIDDEDPSFDELGDPGDLPYRRAVGE